MADRVAEFVNHLQPLLGLAQQEEVRRSPLLRMDDPTHLARYLIHKGWLTPFQVHHLVSGKGRELVLGPFRLLDRLGEGATAQVYRAYQQSQRRMVALKLIRKDRIAASANALRRFQREIQVAASLNHPNIVAAYEAGQVGDVPYLAMELIEGTDLRDLVKESGPLAVPLACDYLRQAALGLQYAHERGLVHRDIKPANLIRCQTGVIKILDFGLARLLECEGSTLTRPGAALGSPEYLAPEQAHDTRSVDARADLYSLGCTAYYLLAGKPPFRTDSLGDLLAMHRSQEPSPLSAHRSDVPTDLQALIRKLLAKDPAARVQSAAEVAAALAPWCPRATVTLVPEAIPIGPSLDERPRTRRRGRWALRLLLLTACLGGLAAATYPHWKAWLPQAAHLSVAAKTPRASQPDPAPAPPAQSAAELADVPMTPLRVGTAKVIEKPAEEAMAQEPAPLPRILVAGEPPRAAGRPAVPAADLLAEAERLIRDTFAEDFAKKAPADVQALAGLLLETALETNDNPPARYALLQLAASLAVQGDDYRLALRVIDSLDQSFDVRGRELKLGLLDKACQKPNLLPTTCRTVALLALEQVEACVEQDDHDAAQRLLKVAQAAGPKGNSPSLTARIENWRQDAADIAAAHEQAQEASRRLAERPFDAEASLQWGRFVVLYKGDWGAGLLVLAQGGEDPLALLADRDLAQPDNPVQGLELANAWWELAQKQRGLPRKHLVMRARHWYGRVAGDLTGFNKSLAEKRLKEIEPLLPPPEPVAEKSPIVAGIALLSRQDAYARHRAAARAASRQGDHDAALQALAEAEAARPDDLASQRDAHALQYQQAMTSGFRLIQRGQAADAAKEFEHALLLKPGDRAAAAALHVLQSLQGKPVEIRAYRKLLAQAK